MSSNDNNNAHQHSDQSLVPTDKKNIPIKWDDVDGHIKATVEQVTKWMHRTGNFVPLITHRAFAVRGKITVDSLMAIPFMDGDQQEEEPFTVTNPCPPTVERVDNYNVEAGTAGTPEAKTLARAPDGSPYTVSAYAVSLELNRYLSMWINVFGECDGAEEAIDDAKGDGNEFVRLIMEQAENAEIGDEALGITEYQNHIAKGVEGALTLESLKTFTDKLAIYKANVKNPQGDLADAKMISMIAFRDKEIRQRFNLEARAKKPTNLATATAILKALLREDERAQMLDDAQNGKSLATAAFDAAVAKQATEDARVAARVHEEMAALAKKSTDTRRGDRGDRGKKDKNKKATEKEFEIPRDKDNNIIRWVKGMSGCKTCGGEHLHRDCDQDSDKASKDGSALVLDEGLEGDELAAVVGSFFNLDMDSAETAKQPAEKKTSAGGPAGRQSDIACNVAHTRSGPEGTGEQCLVMYSDPTHDSHDTSDTPSCFCLCPNPAGTAPAHDGAARARATYHSQPSLDCPGARGVAERLAPRPRAAAPLAARAMLGRRRLRRQRRRSGVARPLRAVPPPDRLSSIRVYTYHRSFDHTVEARTTIVLCRSRPRALGLLHSLVGLPAAHHRRLARRSTHYRSGPL